MRKIKKVNWHSGKECVGIIVAENTVTQELFCYIGVAKGISEEEDIEYILDWGQKLPLKVFASMYGSLLE